MGRAFGFIGLLIAVAIGGYLYTRQTQALGPGGATPKTTIDVTGARNDLIAIANAERRYWATNSKYVSLDELRSNGDISLATNGRGGYAYTVETSESGFKVVATYGGPDANAPKRLSVDETMTVKTE